jgi:hypothetical protein
MKKFKLSLIAAACLTAVSGAQAGKILGVTLNQGDPVQSNTIMTVILIPLL